MAARRRTRAEFTPWEYPDDPRISGARDTENTLRGRANDAQGATYMDVIEKFMRVHQVMEEMDSDVEAHGVISEGITNELEERAHQFYDAVEQLRAIVRFRREVGV